MLSFDTCYERIAARDHAADGLFVVAVTSTGIFCRPGCPARTPLRRHMRFFATPTEAMAGGFRPCRRCLPLGLVPDVGLATVAALCRHIEDHASDALDLAGLAARAGYSVAHFQRRFTALVGLSPRAYHTAVRAKLYRRLLRSASRATDALFEAGYGSTSRVGGIAGPLGAVTPTQYRRGGGGLDLAFTAIATPFGQLTLAASARGIAFAAFGPDALGELAAEFPAATVREATPDEGPLAAWAVALIEHLSGRAPDPRLPLDIRGTAFQHLVWGFLQKIPSGETRSYAEVASAAGRPAAVRAAASACGANRISLLIPCHRVIRGDGGLGGYRWGLDIKRSLIAAEKA